MHDLNEQERHTQTSRGSRAAEAGPSTATLADPQLDDASPLSAASLAAWLQHQAGAAAPPPSGEPSGNPDTDPSADFHAIPRALCATAPWRAAGLSLLFDDAQTETNAAFHGQDESLPPVHIEREAAGRYRVRKGESNEWETVTSREGNGFYFALWEALRQPVYFRVARTVYGGTVLGSPPDAARYFKGLIAEQQAREQRRTRAAEPEPAAAQEPEARPRSTAYSSVGGERYDPGTGTGAGTATRGAATPDLGEESEDEYAISELSDSSDEESDEYPEWVETSDEDLSDSGEYEEPPPELAAQLRQRPLKPRMRVRNLPQLFTALVNFQYVSGLGLQAPYDYISPAPPPNYRCLPGPATEEPAAAQTGASAGIPPSAFARAPEVDELGDWIPEAAPPVGAAASSTAGGLNAATPPGWVETEELAAEEETATGENASSPASRLRQWIGMLGFPFAVAGGAAAAGLQEVVGHVVGGAAEQQALMPPAQDVLEQIEMGLMNDRLADLADNPAQEEMVPLAGDGAGAQALGAVGPGVMALARDPRVRAAAAVLALSLLAYGSYLSIGALRTSGEDEDDNGLPSEAPDEALPSLLTQEELDELLESEDTEHVLPGELTSKQWEILQRHWPAFKSESDSKPAAPYSEQAEEELIHDVLDLAAQWTLGEVSPVFPTVQAALAALEAVGGFDAFADESGEHLARGRRAAGPSERDRYWEGRAGQATAGSLEEQVFQRLAMHSAVGPELAVPRECFPKRDASFTMMDKLNQDDYSPAFYNELMWMATSAATTYQTGYPDKAVLDPNKWLHLGKYYSWFYVRAIPQWARAIRIKKVDKARAWQKVANQIDANLKELLFGRSEEALYQGIDVAKARLEAAQLSAKMAALQPVTTPKPATTPTTTTPTTTTPTPEPDTTTGAATDEATLQSSPPPATRDEYWEERYESAPPNTLDEEVLERLASHLPVGPELAAPRESFPLQDSWFTLMNRINFDVFRADIAAQLLDLAKTTALRADVVLPGESMLEPNAWLHLGKYYSVYYMSVVERWSDALKVRATAAAEQYQEAVRQIDAVLEILLKDRSPDAVFQGTAVPEMRALLPILIENTRELAPGAAWQPPVPTTTTGTPAPTGDASAVSDTASPAPSTTPGTTAVPHDAPHWKDLYEGTPSASLAKQLLADLMGGKPPGPDLLALRGSFPTLDDWFTMMDQLDLSQSSTEFREHVLQTSTAVAESWHVAPPSSLGLDPWTWLHLGKYYSAFYMKLVELWGKALLREDEDQAKQYEDAITQVASIIDALVAQRGEEAVYQGFPVVETQQTAAAFTNRTQELTAWRQTRQEQEAAAEIEVIAEEREATPLTLATPGRNAKAPRERTTAEIRTEDVFQHQTSLINKFLSSKKHDFDPTNLWQRVNTVVAHLSGPTPARHYKDISSRLFKPSGAYGSLPSDIVPRSRQQSVIAEWMNQSLLGSSLDVWVMKKVRSLQSDPSPTYLQKQVGLSQWIKQATIGPADVTLSAQAARFYEGEVIRRLAPTFVMWLSKEEQKKMAGMDVTQPEWGLLHAGAMMMVESETTMQGLTRQQISDVGAMVFALLQQGAAPPEYAEYFRLPALIHHALTADHDENPEDIGEEQMQQIYERYFDKVDRWLKEQNPVHRYAELSKDWKTRPELARRILTERGIDIQALKSYLGTHFAHTRTNEQGIVTPVPNIDEVFSEQNKRVGNAYQQVDELLLTDMLMNLPAEMQDFLTRAKVKFLKVSLSEVDKEARNPPNPFKKYESRDIEMPATVDILQAVTNDKQERIYALKSAPGSEPEWKRVDRIIADHMSLLGDSALPKPGMDYFLSVKDAGKPPLKERGAPLLDLTGPLSELHGERVASALEQQGYEATPGDKVGKFLLNFIPFYECITEAAEGNVGAAVASCAVDLASLIPFLGQAGRAAKFVTRGLTETMASALRVGATQATVGEAIKGAAKQFARQFPLVGTAEATDVWKGVGRSFLRGVDPGFEQLLWGGSKALESVRAFTRVMKKDSPAIAKLDVSLTLAAPKASTSKMPDTSSMYYAGSGPGFGKYLDVMPSGKMNGRQTYVQVNLDTGQPFGPRYIRNGVGNLELAPVSIGRRLHLLQPQSRIVKNADRIIGPAATAAEGFTDAQGVLLYGEAFSAVAKQYNVVLSVRAPNPLGETLLREGYPSKNFHMKGKSSPTGPTAGFIAQNPRYSKVKPAAHEKQAKEIAAAQAKGSQAVPLVLTKDRVDELVRTGNMRDLGDGRYSAEYPSGTEKFEIDASGAVKDESGNPVMVMTNPPEKGKYPVVEENKLGRPRLPPEQRTRPGRKPPPADTTRPITADYDLFSMIFSENRSNNARPYIVAPRLIRGQFELRPLKSRPAPGGGAEDPDMGNISFATERVIKALNQKINEEGYQGGKLVWHGDETANPFSPGFDIADKPIYFLPSGEVFQVHSRAQLNDLHDLLRQRGYAPEISPRF